MEPTKPSPYRVAASMMASDRRLLVMLYPILLIPEVFELWLPPETARQFIVALIVERICELTFLAIVGLRWTKRLHSEGPNSSSASIVARLFLCGFIVSFCIAIPLFVGMLADESWKFIVGLCLLAPGTAFAFRHFFYFVPALLGVKSVREIFFDARELTNQDRLMPFKVLLAPFAVTLFCTVLAISPLPDGRSLFLTAFSSAFNGLFWLLSTYLGLAIGFGTVSLTRWRAHNMEPYREERFDTLAVRAPNLLSKLLTTRVGIRILAVAIFFWLGNYTRSATMPPAPHISLDSISVKDKNVSVHLTLKDPEYHFRGFSPSSFMLAGESGIPISIQIPKVQTDDDGSDGNKEKMSLKLEFATDRSSQDIKQLEDLWLWYQFSKLFPISKRDLGGVESDGNKSETESFDEEDLNSSESSANGLRPVKLHSN